MSQATQTIGVEEAAQREFEAEVYISGYTYVVDWGDEVSPRRHYIAKDKSCGCGHGQCPSVGRVTEYLKSGGEKVKDHPKHYFPQIPKSCPQCAGRCFPEHSLDSPHRGLGWSCIDGGVTHYWQWQGECLKDVSNHSDVELYTVDREGNKHGLGVMLKDHLAARESAERWYYSED